jgi:hypothetical protein
MVSVTVKGLTNFHFVVLISIVGLSNKTGMVTVNRIKVPCLQFTGSQESILHMDIEDAGTLGSGVNNDTDRLQRRNLSPALQIRPMEHQVCQLCEV